MSDFKDISGDKDPLFMSLLLQYHTQQIAEQQ